MNSLSEQVAQETWEMMFRMLGIGTGIAADMFAAGAEVGELSKKALLGLIERIQKYNAENKDQITLNPDGTVALEDLVRKIDNENAKMLTMAVADEDVSLLKEQFKKQGITFVALDLGFDDCQMFMFSDRESKKAELAVMQTQAERGLISDVNPDVFFGVLSSENIGTLSGLDNVELELFRFYAKRNGLLFTSVDDKGLNTIVYNFKSANKAKATASDVLWSCAGENGALVRTQMEYKISNRKAVNRAFLDTEREYYIVNGNMPENYIHITSNDFTYYKKSQKVFDVSRSNDRFMDRAIQAVNSYDNPVLLSKEEFERFDDSQLKLHIENAIRSSMDTVAFMKALNKQNKRRALIEEKMALDDENQGSFWLFDDSISYSEGSTHETLNDLDDSQRETVYSLTRSSERFTFNEYKVDDKNLDYLIQAAENQRDRGYRYAEDVERNI